MSDDRGKSGAARKSPRPILALRGVRRHYPDAGDGLTVLDGAELEIYPGQMVALIAPSGAGKSTLLQIAGLLEHPDAGEVFVAGRAAGKLSDLDRTVLRRQPR